jgi:hypothetical protein
MRSGGQILASDQHPDHNVREGERFIANTFNAIRTNPDPWQSTALLIVYDEHGGIYDHVVPPTCTPDGYSAKASDTGTGLPFNFDRLGIRVPAILVSPWIPRGTVVPGTVDKFAHNPDCIGNASKPECKPITRDLQGTIGFQFFLAASAKPGDNVVPFYFQPTLGGSDINGNPSLASYQDYRFRAPNVMFVRESFEHSLWNLPLGVAFTADQGKVALTRGDFGSNPWMRSFSTGLTLRAGGFPQVFLLFSWGGNEGTHTIANVNTSLLGGSQRPSLY